MACKICQQRSMPYASATILNTHPMQYFRCVNCGFIQTEEPYWLDEAYSAAITKSDIGLAGRSVGTAKLTALVIRAFFDSDGRFLDYGGGYGLMVRLMRDAGFDYYREDKFCQNLFAADFDLSNLGDTATETELVSAFEVFEHLVDPVDEVATMLEYSRSIFFSTTLLPEPSPRPEQWWYFGLEHGQHVSLYTRKALTILGGQFGLRLYSDNRSLHLLTDKHLSQQQFRLLLRFSPYLAPAFAVLRRRHSLLQQDFHTLTGHTIQ